ncbi:MAG TPA: efflux RND transporter periplasmic adaptor subunit [Chlorobiota bacterium]|nr:efflux RND transporter periplasmic adaptor subunit [Chlorobiota bacterium]
MAKKKSRKALVFFLIAVVAVIASAVAWFLVMKREGPILVTADSVETRTITQTVSAIGKLQPEVMVKISSEASGEIIYLGVRDGDTVRSGQLVARIQPDIVNTQLDQSRFAAESSKMAIDVAKAELDRTEADFKRIGELVKKDFATREEYDRARAAYNSAAARYASAQSDYQRSMGVLRQTQATASRTTIFSPMNGVVTYLAVEAGEKVVGTAQMQGTEMMRISDLSTMNAWVDVDENDVALISVGDTARIRVDALRDTVYRGVVYEISHSPRVAAQGTQEEVVNFQVRIRFVDKDVRFRPGMSCNVDIETETRKDVVAVPLGAVTVKQDGSEQGAEDKGLTDRRDASRTSSRPPSMVWIVDKSSVSERIVKTGISDQGYIEILSGVKKGESIVVAPYQAVSKLLRNGAPVKLEDAAARRERFRKMRTE